MRLARQAAVAALALSSLMSLARAESPTPTRPSAVATPTTVTTQVKSQVEPSLPPILAIDRDASDSSLFTLRLRPLIDGTAKVEILGDRAVQWVTTAPTTMTLRKGQADRRYQLRLGKARARQGAKPQEQGPARARVTYMDAAGRPILVMDQPLPVLKAATSDVATTTATTTPAPQVIRGTDAGGAPIRAVVPADAPIPQVTEQAKP
jgi:hypothetical protein